jgi:Transcriptional repressor TCF25
MALARYVLAMDPLRDPMSVLVLLDFFALSTKTTAHDMFVINLVEKAKIALHYRDEESKEFVGKLTDMPNWAFSYALALYRVEQQSLGEETIGTDSMASKDALVAAIRRYPNIVEEMLRKNDISTTGRSTHLDWPPVLQKLNNMALPPSHQLGYDPIIYYATKSAGDVIATIFVQRSFKLWGDHGVQKWLYMAAVEAISADPNDDDRLISPALQRYARIDKADFEGRFQLLPAEANPLDPGLLAISLVVDTNRRRFLRRGGDRGGQRNIDPLEAVENRARAGMQGIVIGGPPVHDIDPDSPILEVLWQSMLPWNRVQGVPPPRR